MLLEEILTLLSRLPRHSWLGQQLENEIVTLCELQPISSLAARPHTLRDSLQRLAAPAVDVPWAAAGSQHAVVSEYCHEPVRLTV